MQLYAGLPIITNKITADEQQGVPHHLLGCIGLDEQPWVVGTFVQKALSVIEDIRARGKLPILVGGTHYYTQSLLFKDHLAVEDASEGRKPFVDDTKEEWPILQQPNEVLLEELSRIDPTMANRWHPNDRRKIQRSLEIYLQTGKKASDVYAEQRERKAAHLDGEATERSEAPAMRFPTLMFWIYAETDTSRDRLDERVDKMVDEGLLVEVQTLHAFANNEAASGSPVNETKGIWVSIGYKEFKDYARALEQDRTSEHPLEKLKAEATERTKIATRQYAKRQVNWIRIKFINALSEAHASNGLYLLDGTDASSFGQNVVAPAIDLSSHFLSGSHAMPSPASLSDVAAEMLKPKRDYDLSAAPEKWIRQHCIVCGVTSVTEDQWKLHVSSKAHRKRVSKSKKEGHEDLRAGRGAREKKDQPND